MHILILDVDYEWIAYVCIVSLLYLFGVDSGFDFGLWADSGGVGVCGRAVGRGVMRGGRVGRSAGTAGASQRLDLYGCLGVIAGVGDKTHEALKGEATVEFDKGEEEDVGGHSKYQQQPEKRPVHGCARFEGGQGVSAEYQHEEAVENQAAGAQKSVKSHIVVHLYGMRLIALVFIMVYDAVGVCLFAGFGVEIAVECVGVGEHGCTQVAVERFDKVFFQFQPSAHYECAK